METFDIDKTETVWWKGIPTICSFVETQNITTGDTIEIKILSITDGVNDIRPYVEKDSIDEYEALIWQTIE